MSTGSLELRAFLDTQIGVVPANASAVRRAAGARRARAARGGRAAVDLGAIRDGT
jgi:hypothetical protein